MNEDKLTQNKKIEKLVAILNDPKNLEENRKIVQENQEFSKYVNDWYIQKMREPIYY